MAMTTSYPKPDRSTFKPNSYKTPENDSLDIGWAEGVLSDNRPFRMEYWCQDQCSIVTFFFSTVELDFPTPANVRDFLEREGLVRFRESEGEATGGRWTDSAGNEMWSWTVLFASDDHTYADVTDIPLKRYIFSK
jgi:hypothetical protein